jgi:hypothetical protein
MAGRSKAMLMLRMLRDMRTAALTLPEPDRSILLQTVEALEGDDFEAHLRAYQSVLANSDPARCEDEGHA